MVAAGVGGLAVGAIGGALIANELGKSFHFIFGISSEVCMLTAI